MSTFNLHRLFTNLESLRGIAPENLFSLLAGHEKALAAEGFALPHDPASAVDYEALARLLMSPEKLPPELREAFFFVHEMATPEGMECLLQAAEDAGLEIAGKPAPTRRRMSPCRSG